MKFIVYPHVLYEKYIITITLQLMTLASVFLISSYGTPPLTQRASYLVLHSSLFGTDSAVNNDYIVTNSIKSLLIGSKCIPNGTHNPLLSQFAPCFKIYQNLYLGGEGAMPPSNPH